MRHQFAENITREEINGLELRKFEGKIHLIEHPDDLKNCIHYLEKSSVLGFDTESKPSFKKGKKNGIALLQLADDQHAFIIKIHKIGLPDPLKQILANPNIVKSGVAIKDDLVELKKISDFDPANFIDLQVLTHQFNIVANSLKKLCAIILNFRISKRFQVSNWEGDELSEGQLDYAATDAWAGYMIYKKLEQYL